MASCTDPATARQLFLVQLERARRGSRTHQKRLSEVIRFFELFAQAADLPSDDAAQRSSQSDVEATLRQLTPAQRHALRLLLGDRSEESPPLTDPAAQLSWAAAADLLEDELTAARRPLCPLTGLPWASTKATTAPEFLEALDEANAEISLAQITRAQRRPDPQPEALADVIPLHQERGSAESAQPSDRPAADPTPPTPEATERWNAFEYIRRTAGHPDV